jgi:hypothetical protein
MIDTEKELSYNSDRPEILLRDYGRNIQKMVAFVKTIEDRIQRSRYAYTLVEMMKQINPIMKESEEYNQKVWDDLFIIAGFDLDIESPYPKPAKENIGRKPRLLEYSTNKIRIRHYGHNIEVLIDKAASLEDEAEKENAVVSIARLMKSFHYIWNKETVDDSLVLNNIDLLSRGRLKELTDRLKEGGLPQQNQRRSSAPSNNGAPKHSGGGPRKNFTRNKPRK